MNPIISIIVPIYNVEKYLNQAIDSLLNQVDYNYEIILVNKRRILTAHISRDNKQGE